MSLTKLLKAPIRLFKKEVVTFLTIRRYDLGAIEEKLRYISIKPSASMPVLRQKVWHLLDLPDYCEEIIILKNDSNQVIPLAELKKGNDPQHPYVLEVWRPAKGNRCRSSMSSIEPPRLQNSDDCESNNTTPAICPNVCPNVLKNLKQSENNIATRISSSSLFRSVNIRKSRDNFTNVLLKIQTDLCSLSNKLSELENRILS